MHVNPLVLTLVGFVYRDAEVLRGVQRVGSRSLRRVGGLPEASEQVQGQLLRRVADERAGGS